MGDVLKKKYMVATCEHCKKVTGIGVSKDVRNLITHCETLKDQLKLTCSNLHMIHKIKNGTIQALHKTIYQLYSLMTDKQRKKALKISQSLRDEIKKIKKKEFK